MGEFVSVPAGEFMMGNDRGEEKTLHKVLLIEYQIGKYPVSNTEFSEFIKARGYEERRWWTNAGWNHREYENWRVPKYWNNSRFNHPNQPVVGVSWYECQAYCRWRSAAEGQQFRLPSEAEWEKASRGTDRRQFPWGKKFDATRLNSREGAQAVMTTTSVGIYPTGASPYGCLDMAGNVQEQVEDRYKWEESDWDNIFRRWRVKRGGSWFHSAYTCRSAMRHFCPDDRDPDVGFRLSRSVALDP